MRSLDEAIAHCLAVAEKKEREAQNLEYSKLDWKHEVNQCLECAKDHRQLAEWLRKLKAYEDRQDLINKSWQELINYKEGIEKIKMRSQMYREHGENTLASGMEQALDILEEVNGDKGSD